MLRTLFGQAFSLCLVMAMMAATVLIFGASFAIAQDVASSLPPDTTVSVPVGDWLQGSMTIIVDILGLAIGAILTWALSLLPATLRTYITAGMIAQVDQLLGRAVQFALQKAVQGIGSKEITIDVKSPVVADAVQYAIDHGPNKLIAAMGGAQGIEEKIIARLPLPPSASQAPAPAPTTTAATAG